MKKIPSLDLIDFTKSNKKLDFIKSIGEAYENIGFVSIKMWNDGILKDVQIDVKIPA